MVFLMLMLIAQELMKKYEKDFTKLCSFYCTYHVEEGKANKSASSSHMQESEKVNVLTTGPAEPKAGEAEDPAAPKAGAAGQSPKAGGCGEKVWRILPPSQESQKEGKKGKQVDQKTIRTCKKVRKSM